METKYVMVKKSVKKDIISGQYKINKKIPTESELMTRYKVSRYTVRRAIGDLEHEGYIYRVQGGGMYVNDWINNESSKRKNKIIGVITTHIADYIFPNIISGIDQEIDKDDYSLLIGNTRDRHEQERRSLTNMLDNDVAGFIIEPTQSTLNNPNIDIYKLIVDSKKPVVFINSHYSEVNFPYLEVDDRKAEREMVDYLLGLGHERILGVFQVDDKQGVNRMSGFVEAYQNKPDVETMGDIMMYRSNDDKNTVLKQIRQRLINGNAERPTAIACYNDELAIEVMGMLSKMGITVPRDVSVTGFDDYEIVKYLDPSLTTVVHPKRELGSQAAKMLLKMINHEPVKSQIMRTKIITRDSTAKIIDQN